jgi:hypothetical protein
LPRISKKLHDMKVNKALAGMFAEQAGQTKQKCES